MESLFFSTYVIQLFSFENADIPYACITHLVLKGHISEIELPFKYFIVHMSYAPKSHALVH